MIEKVPIIIGCFMSTYSYWILKTPNITPKCINAWHFTNKSFPFRVIV